jgi:hypothetical protein
MRKITIVIFSLLALLSCERELVNPDDVNFLNEELPYKITISGFISTEKTIYRVYLSKPFGILDGSQREPINDAIVSVSDGQNVFLYERINSDGEYRSIDSIQAVPGVEYTVKVVYEGKTYTASDVTPVESCDEIFYVFERSIGYDNNGNPVPPNDSSIGLRYSFQNFGYSRNLIVIANDLRDDFGLDSLSDIAFLNQMFPTIIYIHKSSYPQGVFPSRFKSSMFGGAITDSVELINLSISDQYHEHLITLFNVTEWSSGIFSTIPGNVKTNVSEGGTGYFYAVNAKRIRVTLKDLLNE